jgi:hypothetical protein
MTPLILNYDLSKYVYLGDINRSDLFFALKRKDYEYFKQIQVTYQLYEKTINIPETFTGIATYSNFQKYI